MPPIGELVRMESPDGILVILGPEQVKTIGDAEAGAREVHGFALGAAEIRPSEGRVLYDDVIYTVQVSARRRVGVTQADRSLKVEWVAHGSIFVSTLSLSFRQLGWTELRLGDHGIRVQVRSRKMDFETDYQIMVNDLENQVRGLTARLISHLVQPMDASEDKIDLWSYWLALMEKLWADLARDVTEAWRTLPPQLRSEDRVVDIQRLRKPRASDLRAYGRGHDRFSSEVRSWTTLTPERLYVLQLAQDVYRRLTRIHDAKPRVMDNERLLEIFRSVSRLLRMLAAEGGLERVVGGPVIPTSPLAESHPALRRVVRWHRLLRRGLFPEGQSYFVGPKDISLLYEYWCYLTIVRLVVEESQGVLMVEPTASVRPEDIALGSGRAACARVQLKNGRKIEILYQPLYNRLPTIAQKPDHVIQLQGIGQLTVFDAKYRFEWHDDNLGNYGDGMPIPPVDAVNSMHQYHDAIVEIGAPFKRLVDRALVVFPLPKAHHDNWVHHRFYASIESVGVGAIPLVPTGSDAYLREEIRRCLTPNSFTQPGPSGDR